MWSKGPFTSSFFCQHVGEHVLMNIIHMSQTCDGRSSWKWKSVEVYLLASHFSSSSIIRNRTTAMLCSHQTVFADTLTNFFLCGWPLRDVNKWNIHECQHCFESFKNVDCKGIIHKLRFIIFIQTYHLIYTDSEKILQKFAHHKSIL